MSVKKVAVYASVFSAGALAVIGALALGGLYPAQAPLLVASTGPSADSTNTPVDSSSTPSDLTPIASVARNTFVSVEGTVQRVTDEDEFIVADQTGSITVWTGTTFGAVTPGERVVVRGFVDDDLLIEIYAQEIVKGDGTVLELRSYGGG